MSKITIIGAGNGGLTAAYHLSKIGHDICLYDSPDFDTQIKAIQKTNSIQALDKEHGSEMLFAGIQEIKKATTNIKEAMNYSQTIIMICPSFAQKIFFKQMLPFLKNGQTIILMPGNYGGLVLNKLKNDSDKKNLDVTFVDAISIPWATRIVEPGIITIMGFKKYLSVSIYPQFHSTREKQEMINSILPLPVEFLDNPLIAGLENINFGGHPLLTTLNIGLLENYDGEFNYYKDCCSQATANAAKKMDEERLSVGKAYGFALRTELESMNSLYGTNYNSVYEFNRDSTTHGKINDAPNSSKNRYITEDVPYLLLPCFELAKAKGIKLPIVESCIHLASAYNDEDYFNTGRTLKEMGINSEIELNELTNIQT